MREPRFCYWIDSTQDPAQHGGYVPSVVREDEAGHRPMTGDATTMQLPWVWGPDLEGAKTICRDINRRMGLSDADVSTIVASSMKAQSQFEDVLRREGQ